MKICLVTPAPRGSRTGNRVTALRWARILRGLGHHVVVRQRFDESEHDLLLALHARRSHDSITAFRSHYPDKPVITAHTGTDVYSDLPLEEEARLSLQLSDRIVALQPLAAEQLEARLRERIRVIYQSVELPATNVCGTFAVGGITIGSPGFFDVIVAGHLREVKDPFRPALAARGLDESSRVRVVHFGAAMNDEMAKEALAEMDKNPRYHWLGPRPRADVCCALKTGKLFVLSSRMEGGANVLSEALVAGIPVLASRIHGSVGILGESFPGLFDAGDTVGLATLIARAETDSAFLAQLRARGVSLKPLFARSREIDSWRELLSDF